MEREGEKQHTAAYRAGLVDEIARTMQTLRMDPVPHPGEDFYIDRLAEYSQAIKDLDNGQTP